MAQRKSPTRPRSAPAPRPRDAEQTRAEILRAARLLFATRGYANAGMREIASAAGITPALVVRYFGSKRDLFLAAIESDIGLAPFLGPDRATRLVIGFGVASSGARGSPFLPHATTKVASISARTHNPFI